MEEVMVMMIRSPENPRKNAAASISSHSITTSTCGPTSWKLYENPFYISHQQSQEKSNKQRQGSSCNRKPIHQLHLPISARKIAASFWDLTFIKPLMESELETARAQILELKAELEQEKKARKKSEAMNKKVARELSEERKSREALERVCEELAKEISSDKAEMNRLRKEMEEERKMLRVAEVLREERVQMKLSEAKLLLEEKLVELEASKQMQSDQLLSSIQEEDAQRVITSAASTSVDDSSVLQTMRSVLTEKSICNNDNNGCLQSQPTMAAATHRRTSYPEPENPHIRRGIKGFVEFPKVVRAIGSKTRRHSGIKMECQKAQIRMQLTQKNPLLSNGFITS